MSSQPRDLSDLKSAYNAIMSQHAGGDLEGARAAMAALAERHPGSAAAWNTLGTFHMEAGAVAQAETAFQTALARDAGHAQARANLAAARSYRGDTAGATAALLEAFRQRPQDTGIQIQLGNTLLQGGNLSTAAKVFRRALRLDPSAIDAAAGLATVWEREGRAADALALVDPLVQAGHRRPNLLSVWGLACRRTGDLDHPVQILEETIAGPLPAGARVVIGHVLGDIHDKRGDPAGAMRAHGVANQADERPYDPAVQSAIVDAVLARTGRDRVRRWAQARPLAGPRLVFIVGMPRSGTSLTEQILGSHPAVHAAGEREEIPRLLDNLVQQMGDGSPSWVPVAESLGAEALTDAARWYRERVCAEAGNAQVVTDKMPLNYRYLPLLSRLFPEAAFVHTLRNPLDVALSCYFASFNFTYAFTNRLDWLGHWLRDHDRLFAHWTAELDAPFHASRYEDLVDDVEGRTRDILRFLGLPWHPACLDFHQSGRVVNTASYAQVRRPIYRSSMGRAEQYRPFLGPLMAAMGSST